jgi:hypothetical protein
MDKFPQDLIDLANDEFAGHSFNGLSLMKTLDSLDAAQAAWTATWEGYSAWEVALHVAYYKFYIARALAGEGRTGPYPFEKGSYGFWMPAERSEAAWAEARAYLVTSHGLAMEAIGAASGEKLAETMPKWEMPFRKAAVWLCSHDSYHTAQIRSMGVPGLKEARE